MTEHDEGEIVDLMTMQRDHVALGTRKRELPVVLTEDEWTERAEATADRWRELVDAKEAEDNRRKVFNGEHKERQAEHARLAGIVADKAEPRMVQVRDYGMAGPNTCVTVRIDTGEVIERRSLTARERESVLQRPLDFPSGGTADTKAPEVVDPDGGIVAGEDMVRMEHGEDPEGVDVTDDRHPLGVKDFTSYLKILRGLGEDQLSGAQRIWEKQPDGVLFRAEALLEISFLLNEANFGHPVTARPIPDYLAELQTAEPARLRSERRLWAAAPAETDGRDEALLAISELLAVHDDNDCDDSGNELPPEVS